MYLFYDIEAASLDRQCDIYSFGYVRTRDDLSVISCGNLFFYQKEWKIQGTEFHGLTKEYLEPYAKDFYKNLATMHTLMNNSTVIGKNNKSYDDMVVDNFLFRYRPNTVPYAGPSYSIDIQKEMSKVYRERVLKGTELRRKGTLEEYFIMTGIPESFIHEDAAIFCKTGDPGQLMQHNSLFDAWQTYYVTKFGIMECGINF